MSMDVYFRGVKSPTDEYKKKLAAYRALEDAGLPIPEELDEYFGGEQPDDDGIVVQIDDAIEGDLMEDDGEVLIDISKLPKGVTHIKAILSY